MLFLAYYLYPIAAPRRPIGFSRPTICIPLVYPWYRFFVLLLGLPQSSWLCGKSGGIGRFNDDVVIG